MSQSHELSVLTFNVRMRPSLFGAHKSRVGRIVKAIVPKKYDVVCLQEVFDGGARAEFVKGFKDHFAYMVEVAGGKGPLQDSGLFFATTLPPKRHHEFKKFRLPPPIGGGDFFAKKGVLAFQLALKIGDVDFHIVVFTTHLESFWPLVKERQLRRIASFMSSTTGAVADPSNAAVLLCGDMNIKGDPQGKRYLRMLKYLGGPHDIYREVNSSKPGYTHPAKRPKKRIDYWFAFDAVSDGTGLRHFSRVTINSATVDPFKNKSLSDHLPVEAHLTLRTSE